MDLFLTNQIFTVLISIMGLFLALWVYFAGKKEKVNQIFFLMTAIVILWINCANLSNISKESPAVQLWAKIGYSLVAVWFIVFYFFIVYFFQLEKRKPTWNKLFFFAGLVPFFVALYNKLLVKGSNFIAEGSFPLLGGGKFIYFGFIFVEAISLMALLLFKYFRVDKKRKISIQYFLVGLFIFIIGNLVVNVILPFWQKIPLYFQFGNYSVIFLLGFTALAIVKKNLFGIKVVLTQMFIVLIAFLLFVNFFVSQSIFEYVWKGLLFVAFAFFGILLVKSVVKEIKQKEDLDRLATDIAIANIRLESAYKKLKKLDDAKSEFISIASHQLRTPLAAMKGYTSMLLDGDYGKIPKKALEPIENVYFSVERLIDLVNSLLNISRIEAGKLRLEITPTNLEHFIKQVIKELQPQASKKNLYFRIEKPTVDLPKVNLDQEKMRHTLLNLIDNAIKYTSKGGIKILIEYKESEKDKIRLIIVDTGDGLTKDEMVNMFESFSRGEVGRKSWVGGAGLGLYIVKKFVEMHKGRVWAESEGRGKGSRFVIEIPV